MTAYPIKDFRDHSQYPLRNGLNAWRWEFLRRNVEYQALYQAHKADVVPPAAVHDFGIRSLFDPMDDNAYRGFLEPAGIIGLPTFETVEKWKKVPGYTAERALHSILKTLTEFQRTGQTLVMIDRALPIEPQLEAIREQISTRAELDQEKPPLRNDRRGEWPSYLRILDAMASGADTNEIAATIYPGTDNYYPDFAGRKRVKKAAERAKFLAATFAARKFASEN